MNKTGPIIIIEDDSDDLLILDEIFDELDYKNQLIFLKDGEEVLQFLEDTEIEPFLLMSDINMPKLNGMDLREKVHNNEDLKKKTIPYLFFTTTAEQDDVIDAYSKSIQGFFIKPRDYEEIKETMIRIVEYWKRCESPDYVKNA